MKLLSLFDGIGTARLALDRCGIKVDKFYSSEIDKYASAVTRYHYPEVIELGDVTKITKDQIQEPIDLIIGGSPCTQLSISGKRTGLLGEQSKLFYDFVRLVKEIKPKYFVLENVASMADKWRQAMSHELFDIEPVMINAALVSAQQRKRLFWVGKFNGQTYEQVSIDLPADRHIYLKDILESGIGVKQVTSKEADEVKSQTVLATIYKENVKSMVKRHKDGLLVIDKPQKVGQIGKGGQGERIYSADGKSIALSANGGGIGARAGLYLVANEPKSCAYRGRYQEDGSTRQHLEVRKDDKANNLTTVQKNSLVLEQGIVRKLTPLECERLQSLDDNWTQFGKNEKGEVMTISNTQRYKQCGNGFNCEVVAHILKYLDW